MTARRARHLVRRLAGGGCLLGAALAMPLAPTGAAMPPLGPTSTSQAVDQINRSSMRPMPTVPPPAATGETMIWVPTRVAPAPGPAGSVTVPGHWERRLPNTSEVYVPPVTVQDRDTGAFQTVPGGVRRPVEERHSSP